MVYLFGKIVDKYLPSNPSNLCMFMKKIILSSILVSFVCGSQAQSSLDKRFEDFKNRFMASYWKMNPLSATQAGFHKYDNSLPIPNETTFGKQKNFAHNYFDSLITYTQDKLNENNKIDYLIIENQLNKIPWSLDVAKEYVWNPANYNITESFAYILNEPFDKLNNRLVNILTKLKSVDEFYEAAKKNILNPVPELTKLAIEQINSGLSVFEKDLPDSINKSSLSKLQKEELIANNTKAVKAMKEFTAWLTTWENKPNCRSFRLGKDLYEQKFAFDIQSSLSVNQLNEAALKRKDYLHEEMEKRAQTLWPKYFKETPMPTDRFDLIKMVIDTISTQHTTPQNFQQAIENQLPKLSAFVTENNLVTLDPSKPLKVRKEPGYMAGVAGASISAPGPYEKNVSTYYNVGTLEGWSKEKAESYLREYNDYTLQILNMHEGIPGHYVQLVYSNKVPSIVKAVFGNGSMVEGWAVYSELMMMENGYNDSDEMWLMYYKWNLRTVCNTILDISVHTKNMGKDEAMNLLVRQAFQQKAEAEGKWKRVSVSSVQLTSYFNGFFEILQLSKQYNALLGKKFTAKSFNEKFLSYGSSPVKYISQLMLTK